jgi:hypothetical protein
MLIYLASPYTHAERWGEADRYDKVARATSIMLQRGWHVFSPIVHSHPLATQYGCPQDGDFWMRVDSEYLRRCDELWVLRLPGWKESKGVRRELELARELDIRVRSFFLSTIELMPDVNADPPSDSGDVTKVLLNMMSHLESSK